MGELQAVPELETVAAQRVNLRPVIAKRAILTRRWLAKIIGVPEGSSENPLCADSVHRRNPLFSRRQPTSKRPLRVGLACTEPG